jgi:hypothetical protein
MVEVSILVFGLFYIGWDIVVATLTGFSMSSATLHLSGALLGGLLGVVLLKTEVVDCEGWDVFALWRGDIGAGLAHKGAAEEAEDADAESGEPAPRNEELIAEAKKRLRGFLRQGNVNEAIALHQKMANAGQGMALDQTELLALIKGLHAEKQWSRSVPFMSAYLKNFPDPEHQVLLKLAQILIQVENRPGKALDMLEKISAVTLPPKLESTRQKLMSLARTKLEDGELELEDPDEGN